jgi:thioredoxin 1
MDKKLYYFSAAWCEPCQWASPIAEELFARLKGVVQSQKVDIDKQPELAKEMHVLGVPCFILTENGDVRWRRNGFDTADRLLEELSPHL